LAWVEENGTDGIEYPLQVYFSCYRVLNTAANNKTNSVEQQQARTILTTAHTALLEQAAGISDEVLRQSFLENVETHRELLAAWNEAGQ